MEVTQYLSLIFLFSVLYRETKHEKKEVIAAVLDHLSPPTADSVHTHYGLQQTASPTLCHRSINEITSKQSGSFFPCLHSKRVMWCAQSEIQDRQAACSPAAPHVKRVEK